ncbi:MAG: hypothetical protein A2W63_03530 [Deltaproteobacteria bacterium RIFCSPLOWO2_02_44_9]|uniref:LemA family protein n=1 Tax=Candidatus Amesbacteria bacterium RIFCSPHIGHO2_12_FULL_48_14 TaxID=1797257 RepID=A0A1F4Z7Q0_9BACT|nr:MAG: hypothetical protein A3E17_02960 [Candidatus Amesbacteria bacterium RIFCSPHIGHO2_12_FULL_48_14]OGQ45062.1 MAG: hypothetical protein A2W63_03530 [Deltaproteobacteria bacterium RIFCSPLOWO2_02_44_9]
MDVKIIAGVIGTMVFLLYVVYIYNKLVRLRYAVRNCWSDIDVHLKKRYELLPNLIEAVKGYATHEQETFMKVTELRSACMSAETPAEKAKAENMLMQTLKSLFALAEAYPALKADIHYKEIMSNMKEIDDNIEHSRRFYNAAVRDYNIATAVFPTNIVASSFSFKTEEFFSLENEAEERKPVKANFT